MPKYDIPYAKPGQLMLLFRGAPLNVSKSKSYLIGKMKEHRDLMCRVEDSISEYSIVDGDGVEIYKQHIFAKRKRQFKMIFQLSPLLF